MWYVAHMLFGIIRSLLEYANQQTAPWSCKQLAAEHGITVKRAQNAVGKLLRAGLIEVAGRVPHTGRGRHEYLYSRASAPATTPLAMRVRNVVDDLSSVPEFAIVDVYTRLDATSLITEIGLVLDELARKGVIAGVPLPPGASSSRGRPRHLWTSSPASMEALRRGPDTQLPEGLTLVDTTKPGWWRRLW